MRTKRGTTEFYDGVRGECFDACGVLKEEFTEVDGLGTPVIDKVAEIFYVGKHKGREYTPADMRKLVDSFQKPTGELTGWTVPFQVDHSDSAWDTGGHLREVWTEDNDTRVFGKIRFVGQEPVERAKDGRWSRLSSGLYLNPLKFREVSGTPFPHLTRARTFNEGDDDMPPETETKEKAEEKTEAGAETKPDEKKGEDKAADTGKADGGDAGKAEHSEGKDAAEKAKCPKCGKDMPKGGPCPDCGKGKAEHSDPEMDKLRAQFRQQLEAEVREEVREEMRKEHTEEERERVKFTERSGIVMTFAKAGKTSKAMAEDEVNFVMTLDDDQLAAYRKLKEKQSPLIVYGQQSKQKATKEGGDAEAEAAELMKAQGFTEKDGHWVRV